MSEPMTSVPVPAAMPSEEEMLAAYNAVWQHATGIDAHNAPIVRHEAMSAVLDLFAPILAEKERLERITDAYAACESVARKRLDHIDPALEERLPALCEISRETWLAHKQRAPIMAVDMLEHAKRKGIEARALAAEAALSGERERTVRDTLLHVRNLLAANQVPLGKDFEDVWNASARELYES